MKVINIGENNTVLNTFIAEIRDARIQKDSMRFRANLERVGAVFAYEISKTLDYSVKDVNTPLGVATVSTYDTPLVVAAILRAGLPIQNGLLSQFDHAESAFLSTFRKTGKGDYFKVHADYCTCPSLEGKVLILADPMLATGASMESALQKLEEEGGEATHVHMVCPVASRYAVDQLLQRLDNRYTLWVAAIDEELTSHNYIIPGLGDAGDLAFGGKR
ncbi:MAG: uracil phosphoribosyltransferase [Bacteroidales bacterium]|nr:uracil phosphoribosyltransferase [Bacteroidales bacterium]